MTATRPADSSTLATVGRDIVVVGASAGGNNALATLLKGLPADFPAALFVVVHISPDIGGSLADVLNMTGPLPAKYAEEGDEFRSGVVYVAPPDRHLLVKAGYVRVTHGPRENRWRPAIDPLFRSAAVAYGSRVIGVILSGMLDDGTAGLIAIKKCGGLALVQDPLDAEYPEMPQSALANVEIDYRLPIQELGSVLTRLVRETPGANPEVPRELEIEARSAETGAVTVAPEATVTTGLMCPDCGGPLRERSIAGFQQYRCLVGHGWSPRSLQTGSDDALEASVWAAIRLFRQRANLAKLASEREQQAGRPTTAKRYDQTSREALENASRLQDLVLTSFNNPAVE